MLKPQMIHILRQRNMKMLLKIPRNIFFGQMKLHSELLERNLVREILLNIRNHLFFGRISSTYIIFDDESILPHSLKELQKNHFRFHLLCDKRNPLRRILRHRCPDWISHIAFSGIQHKQVFTQIFYTFADLYLKKHAPAFQWSHQHLFRQIIHLK